MLVLSFLVPLLLVCVVAARAELRVQIDEQFVSDKSYLWTNPMPVEDDFIVKFMVALKQRDSAALSRQFRAVSDPSSPDYGRHLAASAVTELVAASPATLSAAMRHFNDQCRIVGNKDWLRCEMRVREAEKALAVEFQSFERVDGDADAKRHVATRRHYSLPRHLLDAGVEFVVSEHFVFPVLKKKKATATATAAAAIGANPKVTPQVLRTRYNITSVGGKSSKSLAGVAEFQDQNFSPADLKAFFNMYWPGNTNYTVSRVVGQNNPSAPGIEASLDIQYLMGVAPNIPTVFYIEGGMDFWSGLSSWVTTVAGETAPPQTISVSYGDQGFTQPSKSYKDRMNVEFQKLGARGVSVIFASGDSGTGCDFCVWLQPSFPATCPSVTSVGALRFINGNVNDGEEVVEMFGSGSGFSWDFERNAAPYQNAVVQRYLTNEASRLPYHFRWNDKGRATADVSALGIGFDVINGGSHDSVGGTSASAPTFAAVVALINDARLAKGLPSLGFLNTLMYSTAASSSDAFYDVTLGGDRDGCCFANFPAAKGWDPPSGNGSPNFRSLIDLWTKK